MGKSLFETGASVTSGELYYKVEQIFQSGTISNAKSDLYYKLGIIFYKKGSYKLGANNTK